VPARFLAGLLEPAIAAAPSDPPADAAVIAPGGTALVSTGSEERIDERLVTAAAGDPAGELDLAGAPYLYSAAPIGDSSWTALVAGPEEDVLAAADGPGGWLGWALLLEVLLAGLLGALLLRRLLRDADRVDRANVALSERSATAEHATEAKSDFISTLAHEMRTPLAAIGLFAEMLRTDREEPLADGQRRHVDDIDTSAKHALDLLDQTLDISRIESGRLELRPERVSVAAIGIEVVDGLHPLALTRGIELTLEADGRLEHTFVDPVRVRQVMTNFLTNALKFTPTGGRVRLRVARHCEDSFEIAVDDTGIGIAAADPADVFSSGHAPAEPLHPGDEATGFGLAVTKRLVEEMGGSVSVRSRPHEGSTFAAVMPKVASRSRLP
jgi:signal transduction histidine kinase